MLTPPRPPELEDDDELQQHSRIAEDANDLEMDHEGQVAGENQADREGKTAWNDAAAPLSKKKREKKEAIVLTREPGKSLLPFSRVQKIIKADKEIPIIAKDAVYLISLATEEFIKRLCEAAQRVATRENRATVQHKDLATVVRKAGEFLFLEEIIPWTTSEPAPKKPKGKVKDTGDVGDGAPTMLEHFLAGPSKGSKDEGEDNAEPVEEIEEEDIVMNDDGTMYAAGEEMEQDHIQ